MVWSLEVPTTPGWINWAGDGKNTDLPRPAQQSPLRSPLWKSQTFLRTIGSPSPLQNEDPGLHFVLRLRQNHHLLIDAGRGEGQVSDNFSKMWLVNLEKLILQWIGLRENLQETIDFPSNMGLSCKFSLKPIHWILFSSSKRNGLKNPTTAPASTSLARRTRTSRISCHQLRGVCNGLRQQYESGF